MSCYELVWVAVGHCGTLRVAAGAAECCGALRGAVGCCGQGIITRNMKLYVNRDREEFVFSPGSGVALFVKPISSARE